MSNGDTSTLIFDNYLKSADCPSFCPSSPCTLGNNTSFYETNG